MEANKTKALLERLRTLLQAEGIATKQGIGDEADLMKDYVLEAIRNTKDVQKHLHTDFLPQGTGLKRRLKNVILNKIANVSRNTVERSFIKQQKFNDNVALLLEYLFEENQKLRAKVSALEQKLNER